uniref:Uncharacterized protein n=1 Tax=Zea mays TaxID=4577 RepID=A0A804N9F2_MAIZE
MDHSWKLVPWKVTDGSCTSGLERGATMFRDMEYTTEGGRAAAGLRERNSWVELEHQQQGRWSAAELHHRRHSGWCSELVEVGARAAAQGESWSEQSSHGRQLAKARA